MTAVTMRADGKQLVGTKVDVSAALGSWVNAKPESDNIPKLEVTERDGELVVRPYGATDGKPLDWGEAVARPYAASGSTDVSGFVVRYELGPVHTELAANVKQGILVIQSYTSFHDGSDRVPHYAREFFYQSPAEGVRSVGKGVGSLLGEWTNSYSETSWIKRIILSEKDGGFTLRVFGVNEPTDWGEATVTEYLDAAGKPAFRANYDLGEFDAELTANTGQGLVIIVALIRYKEDGRTTWCREFYYRQD